MLSSVSPSHPIAIIDKLSAMHENSMEKDLRITKEENMECTP
jgi:hypothetical protein